MRTLFAGFFLVALAVPRPALADQTDIYVAAEMKRQRIPGLSVAVVRNGEPVKLQGYGLADVENDVPATADTVYLLASVTKQFTAAAVMMLIQEGRIGLDEPVGKYLESAPAAWKEITPRRLMSHTSGLPVEVPFERRPGWFLIEHTRQEFLAAATARKPAFAPGEKFEYSNTGFYLLSVLVEKVSGKTFGEFLRERIFQPLGMTATRLSDPRAVIPHRSGAYGLQNGVLVNRGHPTATSGLGTGCLISTARDMARWDAGLSAASILPGQALKQMWTPLKFPDGSESGYGFGWMIDDHRGHRVISHGGAFPGTSTHITRFVDDKLTVIVLANRDQVNPGALAAGIASLYEPGLGTLRSMQVQPDPDPGRTARMKQALAEIGAGAEPAELTAEARASLKRGLPWVERLRPVYSRPGEFQAIACETPRSPDFERNGARIERICYYRMQSGGRVVDWSAYFTRTGKVAELRPARE
ncbi:MAG TPA: serine hydrolase domain-containing protein [Bryobacteraceae bacterium]|nr:serine hydrolase domain-containing protein [Bryobacteraceae bacterium]